jgi:peptide/nickel transport system ATP-binding protein
VVETAEASPLYTNPRHPYTEALMSAVPIHNPRLRNRQRRIRLEGEIADPANPPSGCYFHPRCRYVQERCKHEEPLLRLVDSREGDGQDQNHYAACHLSEELDLRGAIDETQQEQEVSPD